MQLERAEELHQAFVFAPMLLGLLPLLVLDLAVCKSFGLHFQSHLSAKRIAACFQFPAASLEGFCVADESCLNLLGGNLLKLVSEEGKLILSSSVTIGSDSGGSRV